MAAAVADTQVELDPAAKLARARAALAATGTVPQREAAAGLPVPGALAAFLPGGLPRGKVVGLDEDGNLAAALVGAAVRETGAVAVVGMPELAIGALAAAGAPLEHLVLVAVGEAAWLETIEALIGAFDVVLARCLHRPTPAIERRVAARLRRETASTTLLMVGDWPAAIRLSVTWARWHGLGMGHGQLQKRAAVVNVAGAGTRTAADQVRAWLPAGDGTAQVPPPEQQRPRLVLVADPASAA